MAQSKTFKLHIVGSKGTVFDGEVESVNLNTEAGYITVLPDHSALISTLAPGVIEVRTTEGVKKFDQDRGVIDISPEKTVILMRKESNE